VSERQQRKAEAFRALHEGEPFVIPNPWDAGSARMLEALGYRALATTSSGFAFTLGKLDGHVTLEEVAAHVAALDAATELPVSVDLENGYESMADGAAAAIRRVAKAGAVGGSIEDWDPVEQRIYDFDHAVERVGAAATVALELGFPFTFTARAENHIRGRQDLDDTIARLQAFEEAGADVLYAPGLRTVEEIGAVCNAVSKPVNVLARRDLSLDEIVAAGAQRISVGGALTWTAANAFASAATEIRDRGVFSSLGDGSAPAQWVAR
jgi:2-methylisocitrate lyase-like PEP mutase family enzyme